MYFMFLVYFFGCTTWLAVPPPGFKPGAPEGRSLSPNHWTAGQFPHLFIIYCFYSGLFLFIALKSISFYKISTV